MSDILSNTLADIIHTQINAEGGLNRLLVALYKELASNTRWDKLDVDSTVIVDLCDALQNVFNN